MKGAAPYDFDALRRLNRGNFRTDAPQKPVSADVAIQQTTPLGGTEDLSDKKGLMWLGENVTLRMGNFVVSAPMTYCYTGRADPKEASCVCTSLSVADLPESGGLGYWPSYFGMTPGQRAFYLRWLAEGKNTHLDDIGYAFVYFYGLERRALMEKQDIPWIRGEVRRLLARYPASRSFRNYLGGFLTYLYAENLKDLTEADLLDLHAFAPAPPGKSLPLLLAWYALHGVSLSPEQSLYVLRSLPGHRISLPLRCRELFYERCRRLWPLGFPLSASSRRCLVEYGAASATLSFEGGEKSPPPVPIANVLGKMSQFKELLALRKTCLQEDKDELVPVRRTNVDGGAKISGEPLPPRKRRRRRIKTSLPPTPPRPPEILIDMEKLVRLRQETESVNRRLEEIFNKEETDERNTAVISEKAIQDREVGSFDPLPFSEEALNCLDPQYIPVLSELLRRTSQSAGSWGELARRYGFMPNALLDALNLWGEEALGDFLLLDEGEGPVLNPDVVKSHHM
ncbi:MAG: TerB N-terminal domain-containing protein [Synergistaceae bacterium]|jgi:hypothetical protein|nr:TerB N-terminal domain-containing protein [Synergistaceae bacterium]